MSSSGTAKLETLNAPHSVVIGNLKANTSVHSEARETCNTVTEREFYPLSGKLEIKEYFEPLITPMKYF